MAARGDEVLAIAFVGAGAIHFGGAEGPWDHASRLEKLGGVEVVAIVDPDIAKAEQVLKARRAGQHGQLYHNCSVLASVEDLLARKQRDRGLRLDAIFLGIPPICRGSAQSGKDLEVQCVQLGCHLFVEKPLSVAPPEDFRAYEQALSRAAESTQRVVSVGYMFRYHAAVDHMKRLIASHGGKVMAINGRYNVAYTELDHAFWWKQELSGGPIVEQLTHFCDLARYLGGDVDLTSVTAKCLRETDEGGAGVLSRVPPGCEDGLPAAKRVPRVTIAMWRFLGGGLGTLTHTIAVHGRRYETVMDVLMDGLRMTLYEPYTTDCRLLVRDSRTGSDSETAYPYGECDPYAAELATFLDAVRNGDKDAIRSSYADAAHSYYLSWAIRRASEKDD